MGCFLQQARHLGYSAYHFWKSDSEVVSRLIVNRVSCAPQITMLVDRIHELVNQEWMIEVTHTYHEGNICADWLTKQALYLSCDFHFF